MDFDSAQAEVSRGNNEGDADRVSVGTAPVDLGTGQLAGDLQQDDENPLGDDDTLLQCLGVAPKRSAGGNRGGRKPSPAQFL
jgi:hypothetical protein